MTSSRSRQKSCQACAAAKVKCDLQYPCSRCASRQGPCIFLNDPAVSREKRRDAKERRMNSSADYRQSSAETVSDSCLSSTPSSSASDDTLSPTFCTSPTIPDTKDLGCAEAVWKIFHADSHPYCSSSTSNQKYMDFSWLGSDDGSGDDDSYYTSVLHSALVPHCVSTNTYLPLPSLDATGVSMYDIVGATTTL
ncbi:uncharacterized protein BT62DRAFT_996585 [Guyanagaster necrorhizus]|uniref:Zn(2)-C6 fungal-type domain-containing protein n=1 Tax=Guyanagaster necrorhizus TaxID=856835 RepID=A0A9P7VKZ4_9AGAR|nr:uncharacterized protein BT62DRAFT_996585 [Guyanagaster necrorhizus MCA 3950]KAG7442407.1 hypothetical protein BT62DRAFT_996585 [Guyanagaster necrorhizus MCA 3950]